MVLLLTSAAGGGGLTAQVQERPNASEARRAIAQLRSPYCPGLMLEACPSGAAAALRDSIYDLAAQGMGSDSIIEWMLARHGEEWRGVPQRQGAGLWAWVIPPLALIAGLAIIAAWLRASRRSPSDGPPDSADISADDRNELAHALREWQDAGEEEI